MAQEFFNQEAETAVLSLLILNPDLLYENTDLKTHMFSSSINQHLFDTIVSLAQENLVPEINLLENYLISKDTLKESGGKEYLKFLASQSFNKANFREFEKIICNNYKARSLISMTTELPQKVKDTSNVDSVIQSVRNILDSLEENTSNAITSFSDVLKETWNDILERIKSPGIRGVTTGFKSLDIVLGGFSGGDLVIVGGRPGQGKTAMLCNSALNSSKQGIPSLIFEREMGTDQLVERMLAIETGISISEIRLGQLKESQMVYIVETIKKIKDSPMHFDTKTKNIDEMILYIRKYNKLYGVKVVYIDYIQLLTDRDENQTSELGRISMKLKNIARELDITVVLLSQLNRSVEMREDKRPVLSDLRQSGNLEEDADIAIFLYRDEYYNEKTKDKGIVEFLIRKNRNGQSGTLLLNMDLPSNRITCR